MHKYKDLILILFLILILNVQCPESSQANETLVKGYAYSLLYEYKDAIGQYEKYIKAYPKSSKQYIALNNKGNIHYHLGNFDNAHSSYETALKSELQSDYAKAIIHYNLANTLISIEDDNNIDKDKQGRNSNQPSTKRNRSLETKNEMIIKEFEQSIQYKPLLEAYNNLSLICSSQEGGQETAIQYLENALRISTDKEGAENTKKIATVHFNLGNLIYQQKSDELFKLCEGNTFQENDERDKIELPAQENAAQSVIHSVIEKLSEKIKLCKKDRECKKEAVRRWREALKQQPSFFTKKNSTETGRFLRPNIPAIERKKREACLRINFDKFVDVIHEYETAISLNPYFLEAYNNLGNLYLESSRFEEAIKYFHKALHLDPKAVFVHNNLGVAFFKSGQIEKGEEQYQIVKQLRKNFLQGDGGQGQHLALSAELEKGRMSEWGPGYSQSLRASSLCHFQPEGYAHTISSMILWNVNQFFAAIDIPIAASKEIYSMLAYTIVPKEEFNDLSLRAPVVRILAIFYKQLVGGQSNILANHVGTGFLIDNNGQIGYILTAYHNLLRKKDIKKHQVEYEPDQIVVQFLTPFPEARKAGLVMRGIEDTGYSDLALLRVENVPEQIPLAKLSDATIPKKDEKAIAVGHPQGISKWQISKVNFDSINMDKTWSFYGEGINSGYSGGPVYSSNGKVIAMLIEKKEKISKAIPVNENEIRKFLQVIKND